MIRKQEQTKDILAHPLISPWAGNVDFAIVPDMAKEGAFDEAIKGITAVIHLASPLALEVL